MTMKADPNIKAEVICDSINVYGNRLTTMVVTIPRIILAEFNTHRMLSRNSASSRAIPFNKQANKILEKPFIPVQFGKNQKGMQAHSVVSETVKEKSAKVWLEARDKSLIKAEVMNDIGIHKQIVNRLIEPWLYTTIIVSATSWHNLFALRCHKDAQPEFQVAAYRMLEAYLASEPKKLVDGWHIPFGDRMPEGINEEEKIKIAVARCARVSYENFDGEININSDIELHDSLAKAGHWSPFEHVARATGLPDVVSGNFRGFIQYRHTFNNECRTARNTDLKLIMANKPDWI